MVGPQEILIIAAIILVLFGGNKFLKSLPSMGQNIGEGIRELRKAGKAITEELEDDDDVQVPQDTQSL